MIYYGVTFAVLQSKKFPVSVILLRQMLFVMALSGKTISRKLNITPSLIFLKYNNVRNILSFNS